MSGDINVGKHSHVEAGILVERQTGSWFHFGNNKPKIVIGREAPSCRVTHALSAKSLFT